MSTLKQNKHFWLLTIASLIILKVIVITWWRNYYTSSEASYKILTDLTRHRGDKKINFTETFASVKYESINCNEVEKEEVKEFETKSFAVLSGFSISSEFISSSQHNLHFILVEQHHHEETNTTLLKETTKETLKMTDDSSYHIVFCSDHLDNKFNLTKDGILTSFKSVIEEKDSRAVIFLDIESQQIMWPGISDLLHENHIARKNLGYLLAIALGAEYIIDLDGSQLITHPEALSRKSLTDFKSHSKHPVIASLHSNVNNPYVLMGPRTDSDERLTSKKALKHISPRGYYPISELMRREVPTFHLLEEIQYRMKNHGSSEDCSHFSNDIIQSLIDETPDVSAYHLHQPVTFSPQSPRLSIHPSQFAPFNAHATVFSRHAFWALLLPGSVADAASDIWRGYIAQTFLHCTGSLLAFSAPIVKHGANKHSSYWKHSEDESEERLASQTPDLLEFLSTYNCHHSSTEVSNNEYAYSLPHCMIVLYSKLLNRGFLDSEKDSVLIHEWIQSLKSLDYMFPQFYPIKECLPKADSLYRPNWNFADHSFCNETSNSTLAPPGRRLCGDSLLTVVHLNFGHKEVIPIWLAQWQYVYPNPIFYISEEKAKRKPGSCVLEPTDYFDITCNVKDEQGMLAYESMISALTRFPEYKNYLFIHDDAYISHKTLQWILEEGISAICECKFLDPTGSTNWMWIPRVEDSMQLLASYGNFQKDSFYRTATEKFCPELYTNESKVSKDNYLFHYTMSDVFVFTNTHMETFLNIISKYLDVEMFLEAAVPMALKCALDAKEIEYLSFWDHRRSDIEINKNEICGPNPPKILHPLWKISNSHNDDELWWRELEKFISIRYCDIKE